MATVAQLITRIEKRIGIASGMDVQVHAEDQLLEMLRHKYNVLFDDHWWYDYLTLETFTLDGITGTITGTVANKILRFIDIHSVHLGSDSHPLRMLSTGVNPTLFNTTAIAPYAVDPTKMFRVYPLDRSDDVHVWYRQRIADVAWDIENAEDTNVNMDDELLILGTVYDFLSDDASNPDSASKYENQYNLRYQQLSTLGFQHGIAKRDQALGIPNQWSIDG